MKSQSNQGKTKRIYAKSFLEIEIQFLAY